MKKAKTVEVLDSDGHPLRTPLRKRKPRTRKDLITRLRKLRPNAATIKRFEALVNELDGIVDELPSYVGCEDPVEIEHVGNVMIDGLLMGDPPDEYARGVALTLGESVHALFVSCPELVEIFRQSLVAALNACYGPDGNEACDVDLAKLKAAQKSVDRFVKEMSALSLGEK